jgi:hypothetical protein
MNVLIGAGHRNKQGGNQYEAEMNGKKCRAIMDLFAKQGGKGHFGFDLRCYTPDNGLGWSPLDLNEVPVTGFQDKNWPVDLMVELHSEGGGGRTGAFVIYPDWAPDVDIDVRDHGKVFVDTLNAHVPAIGYRTLAAPGGVGVMSEKQTGVGLQGFRLGVFRDTAQFNERTTRMIFEQGAHDSTDRAAMDAPGFLSAQAAAFMDGVVAFFDAVAPGWRDEEPIEPVYAAPAAIPFELGVDLGWQKLGTTDVYSFKALGTARARVIKRAWGQDTAPVSGPAYITGDRIVLCGEFENIVIGADGNPVLNKDGSKKYVGWYLDQAGNRIRRAKVATAFRIAK